MGPVQRFAAGHSEGDPEGPFFRKLPCYIRDLINPREFQDPETLTQWCNKNLEGTTKRAPRLLQQPLPFRGPTPAAPPLRSAGRALPATNPAAAAHRPPAHPRATAATAIASTTPVLDPRPRRARKAAHIRKTSRPAVGTPPPPPPPALLNPVDPPPLCN